MWYFVSPQIVFGEDALSVLDELQGSRCLLVTDETILSLGLASFVQYSRSGYSLHKSL